MKKFLGFVATKHEGKTMTVYDLAVLFYGKEDKEATIELTSVIVGTPPNMVAAQLRHFADKIENGEANE